MSVPQAAAIANRLAEAGLTDGAIHQWFEHPRSELAGLNPRTALRLPTLLEGGTGNRVLELVERDIREGGWAGEAA